MVKPADSLHPSHPYGIFPELNTQCREINRHIGKGHKLGLLFWTAILVVCLVMFGFQIWNLTKNYLQYNVAQTIVEYGDREMEYPDLTVCPLNALNVTKMLAEGFDNEFVYYFLSAFERSYIPIESFPDNYSIYFHRWLATKKKYGVENLEQALLYFALDPFRQLGYCETEGAENFCFPMGLQIPQLVSRQGVCFPIQFKTLTENGSWIVAKQKAPGYTGAAGVTLRKTGNDDLENLGLVDNYLVILSKQTVIEGYKSAIVNDGVVLSKGAISMVSIREKRITRLDSPYSECYSEKEVEEYARSNWSITLSGTYSLELCHRECEALHAMKECNTSCILPGQFFREKHNYRICDIGPEFICVKLQVRKAPCYHCSNLCKYVTWTYSYNNIVSKQLKDNAYISIYHPDMTYITSYDTPADPIASLLSNVGGQLSLWLGFKLATVIQIVYYAIYWGVNKCRGKRPGVVPLDAVVVGPKGENHVMPT